MHFVGRLRGAFICFALLLSWRSLLLPGLKHPFSPFTEFQTTLIGRKDIAKSVGVIGPRGTL